MYNIYVQINLIINKVMIIDTISVTCYKTGLVPRTRTKLTHTVIAWLCEILCI